MRVFNVPSSAPFLRTAIGALLDGRLIDGFAPRHDPQQLGTATIYLPTRRACRMARDVFLDVLDTDAVLLPRIVAIGDIDEDELVFADGDFDLPPALTPLRRRLLLARLITAWAEQVKPRKPDDPLLVVTGPLSAIGLADGLARLMDDMETRQVPWDALDTLVPEEVDAYWQLTLDFLNEVVRKEWPKVLAALGAMEPVVRRDELIAREAARLAGAGQGPVIAAGSTGSMPATAKFLDAVARLPHGAVVLPGLDASLDDDAWASIARASDEGGDDRFPQEAAPTHPQFAMQALLRRMNITRAEVVSLVAPAGGEILLSEAMRPAQTTWQWRNRLAAPNVVEHIARGLERLSVIEAATLEEEALAIAVALREAAETPGKSAALVTPDRALARRVAAACTRWGLTIDDSGGDALTEARAGLFARLAADAAIEELAPAPLLALLKHPLTRLGRDAGGFAREIETLEIALMRGPRPARGCEGLKRAYAAFAAEMAKRHAGEASAIHMRERRAKLTKADIGGAQKLIDALCDALAPLDRTPRGAESFTDLAARHREVVMRLSRDDRGEIAAFAETDGAALETAFDDIASEGAPAGLSMLRGEYREAFAAVLADRVVRRQGNADARIRIYGPLEARLTDCDRVILGGLVEGVWPPQTQADPWLNRGMRGQLGLDLPERRIGLSAHDFVQLLGADEAILSHAAKVGGAPAVASRFLHRLEAVAGEDGWRAARQRGATYLRLARALDRPDEVKPARKPEPKPPRELRPTILSATEIEHWLRDPYTIYARHILKLAELDPVDTPIGAADRGTAIHGAIGDFAARFPDAMPERPFDELIRLGEGHFGPLMQEPEARALWWPRFRRIAQWFADWDAARRSEIAALKAEMSGRLKIDAGERTFELLARADRIEKLTDGRYAIVDFKTGGVPTAKQVVLGISPQLTLEAAMLRNGGFPGFAPGGSVAALTYVKLSGNDPAGLELALELKKNRGDPPVAPDDAADEALRKLEELVRAFEDEAMPYRPLVLSMWRTRYGAYDDLARIKEWAASAGAIDEI